ncbi:hypothetical protein HMPREF0569_1919 [Micrococcus luteus SK58]|nr:hypothetical protein HMPREF0569_1919 [Micrococcus luteus SK58]
MHHAGGGAGRVTPSSWGGVGWGLAATRGVEARRHAAMART